MSERNPIPKDPGLDRQDGSDEPAFDWMKPGSGTGVPRDAGSGLADGTGSGEAPGANGATLAGQPESRADRKAAEAAGARSDADRPGAGVRQGPSPFTEQHPTSAQQDQPSDAEVERRQAQRDQAAKVKPVAPRVYQVLLAVFYPVILLVLAVRAVTSPLFLWAEYNRAGFPGDGYGFNADDRMTYGSYAVDYLSNWSGPRYLGGLVSRSGEQLFKGTEVSHMADVKLVFLSAMGGGVLLIILSLVAMIYLGKRSRGGIRRGLFAGSIVTLVLMAVLGTLALLGWEQFFTDFHRIFFANGTWTFALEDTLIRLFPGQFWIDAGITIAALVVATALVTFILTWPTRRRRGLAPAGARDDSAEPDSGRMDLPEAGVART